MEKEKKDDMSSVAIRRLPKYYHHLIRLKQTGFKTISASQIAEDLGMYHTQVRKDLAATGIVGKPKIGHNINELINSIVNFLGWNNAKEAFLVGVGNLGRAIITYNGLQKTGVNIVAAFDINPKIIGKTINGVRVFDLAKLHELFHRMKVQIGIITTPAEHAQNITDLMINSGVKGIWNFAPVVIKTPSNIFVENAEIYSSLATLTRKIQEA